MQNYVESFIRFSICGKAAAVARMEQAFSGMTLKSLSRMGLALLITAYYSLPE